MVTQFVVLLCIKMLLLRFHYPLYLSTFNPLIPKIRFNFVFLKHMRSQDVSTAVSLNSSALLIDMPKYGSLFVYYNKTHGDSDLVVVMIVYVLYREFYMFSAYMYMWL